MIHTDRRTAPLDSMTVLDFSRVLAGPYCTMVLADLGADVIKVERFPDGDDARALGPHIEGESYCFAMVNRNKRSVAVDLKSAAGREVAQRLAAGVDVIVENFRPGVTRRLGIDYETLEAINPSLVYCSVTGFGQTGPYRHRPGYDIIAQGMSGMLTMTGEPTGGPTKVGIALNDLAAGAAAAQGILAAFIERQRSGRGQYLDLALVDCGVAWTLWEAAAFFGAGELPAPTGTRHRRSAPYQAFRTQDGHVTIGANNDRLWRKLCTEVLDRPKMVEDPRFSSLEQRLANVDELEHEIEAALTQAPTSLWVQRLDDAGVPGGPVLRYDEVLADEQVQARGMVVQQLHPRMGPINVLGSPFKLSATPVDRYEPAPALGQHTRDVLIERGWTAAQIEALVEAGAISEG